MTLEQSKTWWRQTLFWGLTGGAVLGFPVILFGWFRGLSVLEIAAVYGTVVAGALGAAGIRQWGKNEGAE